MSIEILVSLLSLTFLEIILGIDNLVIISIIAGRAEADKQVIAMRLGLTAAWVMRLILLAFALWLAKLNTPLFTLFEHSVSIRDIFMLVGGLFLLIKGIHEIHASFEESNTSEQKRTHSPLWLILLQIMVIDIVFSLDSILTAIGLTHIYWIMATAISIAILMMIFASKGMHDFIHKHPSLKMLALSFVLLIGMTLVADGLHYHIERNYLYFAICFSLFVEVLNIKISQRKKALNEEKDKNEPKKQ